MCIPDQIRSDTTIGVGSRCAKVSTYTPSAKNSLKRSKAWKGTSLLTSRNAVAVCGPQNVSRASRNRRRPLGRQADGGPGPGGPAFRQSPRALGAPDLGLKQREWASFGVPQAGHKRVCITSTGQKLPRGRGRPAGGAAPGEAIVDRLDVKRAVNRQPGYRAEDS